MSGAGPGAPPRESAWRHAYERVHHRIVGLGPPRDVSYWPAVVAVALLATAVGFTASPPVAVGGVLLLTAGGAGWVVELARQYGTEPGGKRREAARRRGWLGRGHLWWGVVALLFSLAMMYAALLYTGARQGALGPGPGAAPLPGPTAPIVAGATVAAVAASVAAGWGVRGLSRHGDSDPGGRGGYVLATGAAVVLGGVFLGARVAEAVRLLRAGFTPTGTVAGSVHYALAGAHALHVVSALLALGVVLARAGAGQFSWEDDGAPRAAALHWHGAVVAWLAIVVAAYWRPF